MLRAFPPISVSSTLTVPSIFSNDPVCMTRRRRWSMNQAVFWVLLQLWAGDFRMDGL